MIYDRRQNTFNIMFLALLAMLLVLIIYQGWLLRKADAGLVRMNDSLSRIESWKSLNYIQSSHEDMVYMLTGEGFFIRSINDYGGFSGSSMQPSIFDGNTLLEIKYTGNMTLRPGQVVRYLNKEDIAIVHRIRAVYSDTVFVQGDNLDDGEFVKKDRVTHIVTGVLFT